MAHSRSIKYESTAWFNPTVGVEWFLPKKVTNKDYPLSGWIKTPARFSFVFGIQGFPVRQPIIGEPENSTVSL